MENTFTEVEHLQALKGAHKQLAMEMANLKKRDRIILLKAMADIRTTFQGQKEK